MKYSVDVNGERVEVDLAADGVRVDGILIHAHLADVEGTPIHLLGIGAGVRRVAVRRGSVRGAYTLWLDGYRLSVDALDERARTIRELTAVASPSGPRPLVAPMPGLVVRVLVSVGEHVEAGQAMVVMEAMKMENELRSASGGTVSAVKAVSGSAVDKGVVLIELS